MKIDTKKFISLLYVGLFILLLISLGQIMYMASTIREYNHVKVPNYGEYILSAGVANQTAKTFSRGRLYICIGFASILIFLLSEKIFAAIFKKTTLILQSACSSIMLVMVILLIVLLPKFIDILSEYTSYYRNYEWSIYDYDFASQAQAQMIMPIITISSIFILSLIHCVSKLITFNDDD